MNLKEEKERAVRDFDMRHRLNGDSVKYTRYEFREGFDSGVLAERERVKKIMIQFGCEDGFSVDLWNELFFNEGAG
jgi:hypothetical protein